MAGTGKTYRKIVTIQQPEHAPWIGFFHKMMKCGLYVYLDNVQFKKRYFENRNKVRNADSWIWLTIPVKSKGRYEQNIKDVEILNEEDWTRAYEGRLARGISGAPFKHVVMDWFHSEIQGKTFEKLVDLNMKFINFGRKILKIETPFVFASELGVDEFSASELILEICKKLEADCYISGPDGRNYLNLDKFAENKIDVKYHDFEHPTYTQWQGGFCSHMSFMDCLANLGPEAMSEMLKSIEIEGI